MAHRKLPHPISKEDFEKLIEVVKKDLEKEWKPRKKEYSNKGYRLKQYLIAMCFGFGAGMRISEIFGLEKEQIYTYKKQNTDTEVTKTIYTKIPPLTYDRIENNFIRIIAGKGMKDGVVPLPAKVFRKAGITREDLKRNLPLRVSYRSTQNYVTKLGKRVLKKHITFHMLRHGFVTTLLNSGMPIHQVQAWARHSRMDTTGLYSHATISEESAQKVEEAF